MYRELLQYGVKFKIEIDFSDINGIEIRPVSDKKEAIVIQVSRPPCFMMEVNPHPSRSTTWTVIDDFTDGQGNLAFLFIFIIYIL